MLRGLQLCDGLVRGAADGRWSSSDFVSIVARRRLKIKPPREAGEGPRGWGSLLEMEELQTLLTTLGKRVSDSKRTMASDVLERILAGEKGFIELIEQDAAPRYFRFWRRGDSVLMLAAVRGTILDGSAYWSLIDTMIAIWPPSKAYTHKFARRYFDDLPKQRLAVYVDLFGAVVSLGEPMMPLQALADFIDILGEHQRNKYAEKSAQIKAELLAGTRVVIQGRAVLCSAMLNTLAMPDDKYIRGTVDGFWSAHDFINVICGRALDDVYGAGIFGDEWSVLPFREDLRSNPRYGPTTTLQGLSYILEVMGESEYGARVALMLQ